MFYCNLTLADIKEIALMASLKFSSAQYSWPRRDEAFLHFLVSDIT